VPAGVLVLVATVSVEVKVGLPEDGVNMKMVPDGYPEQFKETDFVDPLVKVTVTEYVVCPPAVTV
jgi:hypothetical protein